MDSGSLTVLFVPVTQLLRMTIGGHLHSSLPVGRWFHVVKGVDSRFGLCATIASGGPDQLGIRAAKLF